MKKSFHESSGPSVAGANEVATVPVVIVDISPNFRNATRNYIQLPDLERLRKWMEIAKDFGDECGPHGIQMVDFAPELLPKVPQGWKVFFCFNEITVENCVADITLLGADKPDKRVWDRVKAATGDAAYIAGRFFDGVFTVSGK